MLHVTAKTRTPNHDGVLIAFDIMDGGRGCVGALDVHLDSNGDASLVRLAINDDDRKDYALEAIAILEAGYGKIKIALGSETLPLLYARLRALERATSAATTSTGRNDDTMTR